VVPPRAGAAFAPVDTHPLLLLKPEQALWCPRSHQVPSVLSRVRGVSGVCVAHLGGDRLFWLVCSVQSFESPVMAGTRESFTLPTDFVTQPLNVDEQGTQELCRCEHAMTCAGQVLFK